VSICIGLLAGPEHYLNQINIAQKQKIKTSLIRAKTMKSLNKRKKNLQYVKKKSHS